MSRQFTWWRRFWATRKMPKQMLYKGASELQQRIEFGEYEVDNLGREYMLEELIFEQKDKALKKEKPWLTEESYLEQIQPERKQYRKRQNLIMKAHLEAEHKLLYKLREELESLSVQKDEELQKAISNKESEIAQLKLTIGSLRTALDEAKFESDKCLQEKSAESAKEIETLQKGLITLRKKLQSDQKPGQ